MTLSAIIELTDQQAMSVRDVAALLELSPARVGQLKRSTAAERSSSKTSAARRAVAKKD